MELYHLDWQRSFAKDEARHAQLILGFGIADSEGLKELYRDALLEGLFDHVADIDGDDLDYGYMATNNETISASWSRTPAEGVFPVAPTFHLGEDGRKYGRRSTSIGDLVLVDGRFQAVASMGFRDVGPDPRPALAPA
ncbi:MAG: hypothetical protein EOR63_32235 [Mesorhizobium sp.]|nr:MAG: hypothetical protein EOR63_32235 [Mesorhizobium sp.]